MSLSELSLSLSLCYLFGLSSWSRSFNGKCRVQLCDNLHFRIEAEVLVLLDLNIRVKYIRVK